jgi:putative membrane protein insertion efficiency factor
MKKFLILLIKIYQKTLSKILRFYFGPGCRFIPTCSDYAQKAISKHGIIRGGCLSVQRILSCHS